MINQLYLQILFSILLLFLNFHPHLSSSEMQTHRFPCSYNLIVHKDSKTVKAGKKCTIATATAITGTVALTVLLK